MEMPRNLSRGKRIFARDNNKLSSQVYRSAMVTRKITPFAPKKIFKLNSLVFVRHCFLKKKPSPQLRTSFGDGPEAVLKTSSRVFSMEGGGGGGEGASVRTSQSAKSQKDTTRREKLT